MSALPSFSLSWKGKRGSPGRGVVPPWPCPLSRQYPRRSPRLKRRLRAFLMRCALLYRTTLRRSEVVTIQWCVGADILCFGRMHTTVTFLKVICVYPMSDPLTRIPSFAPAGARHPVHTMYVWLFFSCALSPGDNLHEPGMAIQSNTPLTLPPIHIFTAHHASNTTHRIRDHSRKAVAHRALRREAWGSRWMV